MSTFNIQLQIIIDGIKPKLLANTFDVNYPNPDEGYVNTIYSYRNSGVEEIIQAVKVLRDANYKHSYYFAPYEATPQLYYLHDHFCGSSMCAYPDLLFYVWYNFIIDFDLQSEEFEWVKYSKENKLNESRNLSKMFLSSGYYLKPHEEYVDLSTDDIRARTAECGAGLDYDVDPRVVEIVEYPCIISVKFEVELMKKMRQPEHRFEDLYGTRLSKHTYFSLFKGLISPKVCESLAFGKIVKHESYLKSKVETEFISFNTYLLQKAVHNIQSYEIETAKGSDVDSRSSGVDGTGKMSDLADREAVRFISSEKFNEELSKSSEDYINTVNLVCKGFGQLCRADGLQPESRDPTSETLAALQHNQVWPFVLLQLCREIGICTDGKLSDLGLFYSTIGDWKHDHQHLILLLMLRNGFPLDLSSIKETTSPLSTAETAINLA